MKKKYLLILVQVALMGSVMAEGLHLFKHENKYGYFDDALRVAIPPQYHTAGNFHDGFAIVGKEVEGKTRSVLINENGAAPFPELAECKTLLYEGNGIYYNNWDDYLFNVFENKKISVGWTTVRGPYYKVFPKNVLYALNDGLIDSKGNIRELSEGWRRIYSQVDGAGLAFDLNFDMKIIDRDGKVLLGDLFDCAFNFSEGLMAVQTKSKSGFINSKGEFVFECDFVPLIEYNPPSINYFFTEGVAVVQVRDGVYKIFDRHGNVVLGETRFKSASICVDDRILVQDEKNGLYGYLDSEGRQAVSFIFEEASDFYNGYAYGKINETDIIIKKDGKYIYSSELIKRKPVVHF